MLDWLQWAKGMMLGPGYDGRSRVWCYIPNIWNVGSIRVPQWLPQAGQTFEMWWNFQNFEMLSQLLWRVLYNFLISICWPKLNQPLSHGISLMRGKRTHLTKKNSLTKFTKCHPCKMHQIAIFGGNLDKRYAPNSTDFIWIFSARGRSFRSLSLSSQKKTWSMLPFPPCKIFFFSLVCEDRSGRVLCELFL